MSTGSDGNGPPEGFSSNVFVNCPFDEEYLALLRPALFTLVYLGYTPRIASERLDSAENRMDKICELILGSKFSLHDLSRLKANQAEEFYRLNMPFELGIDYGARQYGPPFMSEKVCLILEKDPHAYKRALSDLSGVDIKNHNNEPDEIVRAIRDWFYETVGKTEADYPKVIWNRFNDFTADLFESRLEEDISEKDVVEDIDRMPISEYLDVVEEWMVKNTK